MYTFVYTLEYMDAICSDDLDFSKKLLIHISTTKFPCGTLCQVLLLHRKNSCTHLTIRVVRILN